MYKLLSVLLIFAASSVAGYAVDKPSIIPVPARLSVTEGQLVLTEASVIFYSPELGSEAGIFTSQLEQQTGKALSLVSIKAGAVPANASSFVALLKSRDKSLGVEAYQLDVRPDNVVIRSSSTNGAFYGTQTLLQTLSRNAESGVIQSPCYSVHDEPQYKWRGVMFDPSRHFIPKADLLRLIPLLARYKFNVMHLHLTDDQGWRVEIKKYPKLTGKASWRHYDTGETHGGYYTQDGLREIVAMAASFHIQVIPEIDAPGHSGALMMAKPEFHCFKTLDAMPLITIKQHETDGGWRPGRSLCGGKESVYQFLEDVFAELAPIFPSNYFHIGADEVLTESWEKCQDCQERIAREKLKDMHGLHGYFVRRMEAALAKHGKSIIGWDDIIDARTDISAIAHIYRGLKYAQMAVDEKRPIIVSSGAYFDLDFKQTNLKSVYNMEVIPKGLAAEHHDLVLGAEACLWGEYIPAEHVVQRLLPRLLSFSEAIWSPARRRSYDSFAERVVIHAPQLAAMGFIYGPPYNALPEPALAATFDTNFERCYNWKGWARWYLTAFYPVNAFDGDLATHYLAQGPKQGEFLIIKLASPKVFRSVTLLTGTNDRLYRLYNTRLEVRRHSDGKWLFVAATDHEGHIPYAKLPSDKIDQLRLTAMCDQDRRSFIAIRELILTDSDGRTSLRQLTPEQRLGSVSPPGKDDK